MFAAAGTDYPELVDLLVRDCLARAAPPHDAGAA
jgi:hypothetical protein